MAERILIVEDEPALSESLQRVFAREGYDVDTAGSAEEALRLADESPYDVVVTDIILPGIDGIELLERLGGRAPEQIAIVMTAFATLDTAVRALRAGAHDYVIKPVIHEEIKRVVRNALQARALRAENVLLRRQIAQRYDSGQIVGESAPMRAVLAEVAQVADSRSHVLVLGETGTGKELIARAIHAQSPRRDKPFVPINCSAIPEALMESELFGYQRGAFTGAAVAKRGLLEEADGGTVFLDEIGEMHQHLQSKLLRVIDDRQIRPLGALHSREVDIRFIAASNRDIARAIEGGGFRADLYYRLSVISLALPPLRERSGDVALLARHFLGRFAHEFGRRATAIAPDALRILEAYAWPGNVRELQNVVERAVLLAPESAIRPEHLPGNLRAPGGPGAAAGETAREAAGCGSVLSIEDYTREVVLRHQGECSEQEIATMLGITRKALWEKRKRWGLRRS